MSYSNNIFAVLNEESSAQKTLPREKKAGKSVSAHAATVDVPAGKKPITQGSFPGDQPAGAAKQQGSKNAAASSAAPAPHSARTQDRARDTHSTEGGARGGATRGASRGGRGGRRADGDVSQRQFDRRGAPQRFAPSHAARDGQALGPDGGVAVVQGETVAEVAADVEAAVVAVEEIETVEFEPAIEEDVTKTYDQYLAELATKQVAEDINQQRRAVSNDDSAFNKVKQVEKEEEVVADVSARKAGGKKQKQVITLDEFRGGREADKLVRVQREEYSGAPRGGRGGAFAPRGGRGGAFVPRESRPYTPRAAPADAAAAAPVVAADGSVVAPVAAAAGAPFRGGRGGNSQFAPRGGRGGRGGNVAGRVFNAQPTVGLNDKAAFPALGQ